MATTASTAAGERRAAPILEPGHGDSFTEHAFRMRWSPDAGWHGAELVRLDGISIHPATIGLHYAQVAYEGLKAHRQSDGSMAVFRPWDHARRFRRSTRRLHMPELPEDAFVDGIARLVSADEGSLSANPEHSLYLRPLMYGCDVSLMLRPSRDYDFLIMAFVAGGFFGDGVQTISAWVCREHSRAFPGGTGDVKVSPNYSPTLLAGQRAQAAGCQQVIWLDAVHRRWLEEMSGMNIFLVRGRGPGVEVVTPALSGTLLPGITRDSLLTLAARLGMQPREELISVDELRAGCVSGRVTEVFACGTAAVVTAVGRVCDGADGWTVGDGGPGPVTTALRRLLVNLHHGAAPDPDGWLHPVQ
jgi:branched-chain amino acid aminotransferase